MRLPAAHHALRLLGVFVATLGLFAWIVLAWKAVANLDEVSPRSEEGGRLMAWALSGTGLMIAGLVLLHFAESASEEEGHVEDPQSN